MNIQELLTEAKASSLKPTATIVKNRNGNIRVEREELLSSSSSNSETTKLVERAKERNALSLYPDYAWEQIQDSQIFLPPPVQQIPARHEATDNNDNDNDNDNDNNNNTNDNDNDNDNDDDDNNNNNNNNKFVRFVFISDTHANHRDISHLPRGDVLVHAGDFTKTGETETIQDLADYFRDLQSSGAFERVICVAGNHDLTLDSDYYDQRWKDFHDSKCDTTTAASLIQRHAIYLQDESYTLEFHDTTIHIWGSPYSPRFWDWAFNKGRGRPIRNVWNKIPTHDTQPVDLLITHGPPLGRGDLVISDPNQTSYRAGCYDLLRAIQDEIRPKIHVFGHIHEGYGVTYDGTTLYVNASSMNHDHQAGNLPVVVDVPIDKSDDDKAAVVVQPSSLLRNCKIRSLPGWIQWCHQHGHESVACALEQCDGLSDLLDDWLGEGRCEPPPDQFLDVLSTVLEHGYEAPTREFRKHLASMVFHLFAASLE